MRGNLWIGTENGLFIYDYTDDSYKHYLQDSNLSQTGLSDNAIYSIYKSREEMMWIGSFFGGVNYTSLIDNKFSYILPDNGKQALKGKAISNIIRDSYGSHLKITVSLSYIPTKIYSTSINQPFLN